MALFQKSLTFAAAFGLPLVLAGCPTPDTGETGDSGKDTDADTDTDTDTDSDTDSDSDVDTGLAFGYYAGGIESPGGSFSSGYLGIAYFGVVDSDWACTNTAAIAASETPGDLCPDCTTGFDFTLGTSTWEGPWCAGMGLDVELGWEGDVYGFGWGSSYYDWVQSDGSVYTVGDPVFLHSFYTYEEGEWFPFFYDLPAAGTDYAQQDADGFTGIKPQFAQASDGSVYQVYGYYYRY
jgi:hypothetical protein